MTGWPVWVWRSSGASTRLPVIVIWVSFIVGSFLVARPGRTAVAFIR
jgi:hypothetical protein